MYLCSFVPTVVLALLLATPKIESFQHGRTLQENAKSACSAPIEDALLNLGDGDSTMINSFGSKIPLSVIRSSFYEDCIKSLEVDKDNMIQHVTELRQMLRQNHAFYEIANDPPASDPDSHDAQLGYTIYGEGQGQVNLEERFSDIISSVEQNGATGATFWEINKPLALLHDGHMQMTALTTNHPVGNYWLTVYPKRGLNGSNITSKPRFYYDSDGELQLKIQWLDGNNEASENNVQSINGKDLYTFFLEMAESGLSNNWPSIGARMNMLLTYQLRSTQYGFFNFFPNGFDMNRYQPYLFNIFPNYHLATEPSMRFPDNFVVEYTDGSSEVYYSAVQMDLFVLESLGQTAADSSGGEMFEFDSNELESRMNTPGTGYTNYTKAMKAMEGTVELDSAVSQPIQNTLNEQGARRLIFSDITPISNTEPYTDEGKYDFDVMQNLNISFGGEDSGFGYKINVEDDYVVFKIQGLSCYPDDAVHMWRNMTMAAKEKGIKRVIVDISFNGGGNIVCGNAMALAMFPTVDYSWFENVGDAPRNDMMQIYSEVIYPLLSSIQNSTDSIDDTELTPALLRSLQGGLNALDLLGFENYLSDQSMDNAQTVLDRLQSKLDDLEDDPSSSSGQEIVTSLLEIFEIVNPLSDVFYEPSWTGVNASVIWDVGENPSDEDVMKIFSTVNRGGVETNLTAQVTMFSKDLYYMVQSVALEPNYFFDEYIIVSNGIAGSTTSVFSDQVISFARNRVETNVSQKVISVVYGGTKDVGADDFALSGHPASVGNPQTPGVFRNVIMSMIQPFLQSDESLAAEFTAAHSAHDEVAPKPPYFYENINNLDIPVLNYYDKSMGPGAIPEQYIYVHPDHRIQQIYTNVAFQQSSDLDDLYTATAKFFSNSSNDTESPPIESLPDSSGALFMNTALLVSLRNLALATAAIFFSI